MTSFELSKEQWYKKRDDRTNRLIKKNLGENFLQNLICNYVIKTVILWK